MPTAKYEFMSDPQSIQSLVRSNRTSTDALLALAMWSHQTAGRQYLVLSDTDDALIARLNWNEDDTSTGAQLSGTCYDLGIRWTIVTEAADAAGG